MLKKVIILPLITSVILMCSVCVKTAWVNPGGMWTPSQIEQQEPLLRKLGLRLSPKDLSDPSSSTLQAIVSLDYCSGSLISKEGLIITNHHCVAGMLSYLTNTDKAAGKKVDYVQNGFYAPNRSDERNAGPTERIFVTQSIEDVTDEVLLGLDKVSDPLQRGQLIEDRIKQIVAREEAKKKNIRVEVGSFYRDEKFQMIRKLELKDVRLVYAPPQGVGTYGGDTDNWSWPRHTGDFGIIRAYTGPDGNSAPFGADNVPYKPTNIVQVANNQEGWVKDGDLIFVAGYPGSTERLATANEVKTSVEVQIPFIIKKFGSLRDLLVSLGKNDDNIRTRLESIVKSLNNTLKNREEGLVALNSIGYVQQKAKDEQGLLTWINSDKNRREKWGNAIAEMNKLNDKFQESYVRDQAEANFSYGTASNIAHVVASAIKIVRMAEERPKADKDRHPQFQERNWPNMLEEEHDAQTKYDRRIARAVLRWAIQWALAAPAKDRPESLSVIVNPELAAKDPTVIEHALDALFATTKMEDVNVRKHLLEHATVKQLSKSKDPIIQLALALKDSVIKSENKNKLERGAYLAYSRGYIEALRAYKESQGLLIAPDANSTLRITFGHVKGYERKSDGIFQKAFTYVTELLAKHKKGDAEFEVPENVLEKIKAHDFAPFTNAAGNDVPLNFLAAVDTTGGNSGSAAMNTDGQLIGLLFDGNKDALFSDWEFRDENVRSILVDIRYPLWILDKVANAQNLLKEMGVK